MNIESVQEFVNQCPHLDKEQIISVDLTNGESLPYGLRDNGPIVISTNIIGKRSFSHSYTFFMQLPTVINEDRVQNVKMNQNFQKWIFDQNDQQNYPAPDDGEMIIRMEAMNPVLLGFDPSAKSAAYQVQFTVFYEEA